MTLGLGVVGTGPGRERYDVGAQRTALVILTSGGAIDDYTVRFLGTNANNTLALTGTSLGIATLPGEVSTFNSGTVDGGATLALGPGTTWSNALIVNGASLFLQMAPGSLTADYGSQVVVEADGTTFTAVTARLGSNLSWLTTANVTTLTLQTGAVFDKSADVRGITLTNTQIDPDCRFLDPYNTITFTNPTTVNGAVQTGPFVFGLGRVVKVS